METTLAILLYLQVLCPCTYTQAQVDQAITANEPRITEIKKDPAKTDVIIKDYGKQAANIVIIDPDIE